jgi:hypothetical protein
MLKAASRAEQFGELSLAECLRSQVTGYCRENVERVTRRTIYTDIEEVVEESAVIPSFKSILRVLARDNLKTPTEFLAQFPRSEKVYTRAVCQRRTLRAASRSPASPGLMWSAST